MKVRHTEMDDFFENQSKSNKKQENKPTQRHSAADIRNALLNEGDDDEPKVFRRMLQLPDFGVVISLFGIESIEKSQRFTDNLNNPRFQYGIILNKDMTPSERYPKVNMEVWFEKESVRDKRYNQLLENLIDAGYQITNI